MAKPLLAAVEAATDEVAKGGRLSLEAKVLLQNDVWGLQQRLQLVGFESEAHQTLLDATGQLIRELAPTRSELATLTRPTALPPALDGFVEYDTERVSLSHERLYGYRRLFRIFLRDDDKRRALVSQMVVLDAEGEPHLTSMVGEVEILSYEKGGLSMAADSEEPAWVLTSARVFHRPREALVHPGPALIETRLVPHVPDLGANGFLAEFALPERDLEQLPCRRCHEDASTMMTLPTEPSGVAKRHASLLRRSLDPLADVSLFR